MAKRHDILVAAKDCSVWCVCKTLVVGRHEYNMLTAHTNIIAVASDILMQSLPPLRIKICCSNKQFGASLTIYLIDYP
eukprot:scaffold510441_cov19-Prasinocladus_malaysianus.AAC.1